VSSHASGFSQSTFSSPGYFRYLLNLLANDHLRPFISATAKSDSEKWMEELMAGFVTSADTGNETLVIASRAALSDYCQKSRANLDGVCTALLRNLKSRQGQDRIVVPTLEITAFLFYIGVFPRCTSVDYKSLCLQVQKSCYKTGNVRKLEACVKVYGAVAGLPCRVGLEPLPEALEMRKDEGVREARKRLGALMYHPWPRIRSHVVDELWGLMLVGDGGGAEKLKGVDWGKAEKSEVKTLVEELRLC